jgi:hypothetical protein
MLGRRAFVSAVVLMACSGRPPASAPPEGLAVEYAVEQSRAPRHFVLGIPPHGMALVAALRPLTAAPDGRAGFFGAPMGRQRRAEVERLVQSGSLLARHDEATLEDKRGGHLTLSRAGAHGEIAVGAEDAPARELVRALDEIVMTAAERPVAALALRVRARIDGPQVKIYARFVHTGIQPIEIAIARDDQPTASLRVRGMLEREGRLVDEQQIRPEDTRRLAASGRLPPGWHRIEVGQSYELPPIGVRVPDQAEGLYARAEATVSVRTRGREPIQVELGSALISVAPEER